jgi:hypothetical protein
MIAPATEALASNRWHRSEHSPAPPAPLVRTSVRHQLDGRSGGRLISWEGASSWPLPYCPRCRVECIGGISPAVLGGSGPGGSPIEVSRKELGSEAPLWICA